MMQSTAVYTEQQFIEDVRQAFASTIDARAQAQTIADHMRRIFATGWPRNSAKFGAERGTYVIHEDEEYGHPDPGFRILAYRSAPRPETTKQSPHDHGVCFVVYGVAGGTNVQTRYHWAYPEDTTQPPALTVTSDTLQVPGDAAYFLPGEIHSTQGSSTEETVYVRITSMDLENVERHRYDPVRQTATTYRSAIGPAPSAFPPALATQRGVRPGER